jgi:cell division protein FtsB
MRSLARARLFLACAVVFALVVFAVEFPFSEIFGQRAQLSALSAQLSTMQSRNAALRSSIANLKKDSTIEAIAHQDYGLVQRGQRSFVILPAPSAKSNDVSLSDQPVPISDLVQAPVGSAGTVNTASSASGAPPSFWSRFKDRLEFWH